MIQPSVRTDLDGILSPLLMMAESILETGNGFRPFGARLAAGGQVAIIDVANSYADPTNPLIVDALYATFRMEARQGTIRACGVCWDALVPSEEGGLTDAIAIGLEHRDAEPKIVVCPYTRDFDGIHFRDPVSAEGKRHVFGNVMLA
jgi:hypothetical protein